MKKCFLFLLQLVVIEFSIKDKDFNDRFLFDHGQILSNLSVEYIYIVHTYRDRTVKINLSYSVLSQRR